MLNRILTVALATVCGVCLLPVPAHAYMDPGTGNYLAQLLLSGTVGIAVVFRLFWRRIWDRFRRSGADERMAEEVKNQK